MSYFVTRRGAGLVAGSRPLGGQWLAATSAGTRRCSPTLAVLLASLAALVVPAWPETRPLLAGTPAPATPGDLPTGPGRPPATNARTAGGGAQCAGVLLLRRRAVHGRRPARPGLRLDRPGHRHCRESRRLAQPTPAAHLEQRARRVRLGLRWRPPARQRRTLLAAVGYAEGLYWALPALPISSASAWRFPTCWVRRCTPTTIAGDAPEPLFGLATYYL